MANDPIWALVRGINSLRFLIERGIVGPKLLLVFGAGLVITVAAAIHTGHAHLAQTSAAATTASSSPPAQHAVPSAEPKEDERNWRAQSYDGAVVVTQTGLTGDRCLLEARRGDELLWKSALCVGKNLDFKFVSPSGARLAVLHPLPTIVETVGSTPVMQFIERGRQQYASAAGATVADWKRLRTTGSSFYWLAGALGSPGQAPHYSEGGADFDFATVDGRTYHLALDGR